MNLFKYNGLWNIILKKIRKFKKLFELIIKIEVNIDEKELINLNFIKKYIIYKKKLEKVNKRNQKTYFIIIFIITSKSTLYINKVDNI